MKGKHKVLIKHNVSIRHDRDGVGGTVRDVKHGVKEGNAEEITIQLSVHSYPRGELFTSLFVAAFVPEERDDYGWVQGEPGLESAHGREPRGAGVESAGGGEYLDGDVSQGCIAEVYT